MNTLAYCAASFAQRLGRLAGVAPATCPPLTDETFDLTLLRGQDFVWFKLHGRRNERYWYGDNWTTALSADRLARADLEGAVVFVSNCWLYDSRQGLDVPGPMMIALAQARPKAIVGGAGVNYASNDRVAGSDLLGLYIRHFLRFGFGVWRAFNFAQVRLHLARSDKIKKDTLGFRVWTPGKGTA